MQRTTRAVVGRYRDDLAEWRLDRAMAAIIALIPFSIAAIGLIAMPFRRTYDRLAREDGVVEWLQVGVLLLLIVLLAGLARRFWSADRRRLAGFYGLAALACLFIAGEEISWGQRILGFGTPAVLDAINKQGETNLHNVGSVLKVVNLGLIGVLTAAMVLPLLRWTVWHGRRPTIDRYALVPPLALIPAFLFPFVYRVVRLLFLPDAGARITKYAEFAELSFYVGLLIFALLLHRTVRGWLAAPAVGRSALPGSAGAEPVMSAGVSLPASD